MTYARNRIKHIDPVGDDDVKFDAQLQAKEMLDRAVTDYYHLMNYMPFEESIALRRFI